MSRPAMAEATNRLVTRRDGVIGEKGRLPPLKSSMSQDAGWEVPVRAARRQKVCRSMGDSEVSGGSTYNSVDSAGSALLLDTIRETGLPPSGSDVSRTALWGTRKEPRSSDGSESSYSGRLSSQEEAWSPVSPHVEMTYPKSKLPIHHITTKRSRSGDTLLYLSGCYASDCRSRHHEAGARARQSVGSPRMEGEHDVHYRRPQVQEDHQVNKRSSRV
uniref:Uncharacterized protein n=1 Tax=Timema poppense TaxID=170557 RepID=A0A7R9DWK6_TIMPO|nr:unnamed protein product [Timema poppensis]